MKKLLIFSFLILSLSAYFTNNYREKIVKSESALISINSSINDIRDKLSVKKFMDGRNYAVNKKDMLAFFNRKETGENDLESYLLQLNDTYGHTKYCASPESNPGTCLNFKEGKYADDIIGAAVWANLYGNLDRKLSREAQNKLVKQFMQKANAPLEIQYQLSSIAGIDPSPSSIQEKEEIIIAIKELNYKYDKELLNKQEYYKKLEILVIMLLLSLLFFLGCVVLLAEDR